MLNNSTAVVVRREYMIKPQLDSFEPLGEGRSQPKVDIILLQTSSSRPISCEPCKLPPRCSFDNYELLQARVSLVSL